MTTGWWVIVAALCGWTLGVTIGVVVAAICRTAALEDAYRQGWDQAQRSRRTK